MTRCLLRLVLFAPLICLALLLPARQAVATSISIDFESSVVGTEVYDQFSGVHFRSSLDISATEAPGYVVESNMMEVYDSSIGVYAILDSPVDYLSVFVYEFETAPPPGGQAAVLMFDFDGADDEELSALEGETVYILEDFGDWLYVRNEGGEEGLIPTSYLQAQSVYLRTYRFDGADYFLIDDSIVVHALGVWDEIYFASSTPISAFQLWGTQGFYVDNITIGAAVPEPSTLFLLGSGLAGLAFVRRRFKK
jgi:hypothetical protein